MTKPRATNSATAIFLLGALLAAAPASAQNEAVPSLRPQEALPSPPGGGSAGAAEPSTPDTSLGHQLSRSRGVIKPPPIRDPNVMTPPNQDTVKTPVIAPPGTPGGDPAVIPK